MSNKKFDWGNSVEHVTFEVRGHILNHCMEKYMLFVEYAQDYYQFFQSLKNVKTVTLKRVQMSPFLQVGRSVAAQSNIKNIDKPENLTIHRMIIRMIEKIPSFKKLEIRDKNIYDKRVYDHFFRLQGKVLNSIQIAFEMKYNSGLLMKMSFYQYVLTSANELEDLWMPNSFITFQFFQALIKAQHFGYLSFDNECFRELMQNSFDKTLENVLNGSLSSSSSFKSNNSSSIASSSIDESDSYGMGSVSSVTSEDTQSMAGFSTVSSTSYSSTSSSSSSTMSSRSSISSSSDSSNRSFGSLAKLATAAKSKINTIKNKQIGKIAMNIHHKNVINTSGCIPEDNETDASNINNINNGLNCIRTDSNGQSRLVTEADTMKASWKYFDKDYINNRRKGKTGYEFVNTELNSKLKEICCYSVIDWSSDLTKAKMELKRLFAAWKDEWDIEAIECERTAQVESYLKEKEIKIARQQAKELTKEMKRNESKLSTTNENFDENINDIDMNDDDNEIEDEDEEDDDDDDEMRSYSDSENIKEEYSCVYYRLFKVTPEEKLRRERLKRMKLYAIEREKKEQM